MDARHMTHDQSKAIADGYGAMTWICTWTRNVAIAKRLLFTEINATAAAAHNSVSI